MANLISTRSSLVSHGYVLSLADLYILPTSSVSSCSMLLLTLQFNYASLHLILWTYHALVWFLNFAQAEKNESLLAKPLQFPTTTTTLLPGSVLIYSTFSYINMVKCPCYHTKAKSLVHLINPLLSAQRHCPRNFLHSQFFSFFNKSFPLSCKNVVNSQTFKKKKKRKSWSHIVPSAISQHSSFYREILATL